MPKLRFSLALAGAIMAAVILSAPYASAQQVKKDPVSFAVIDVQLILNTSLAMKNVREQLEVQRKRFQVSIAAEEGILRTAGQKLARQRGVLAPQALARRGRQLRNRVALFQRRFQAKRREIDQAFAATLREFEKELKSVVAEIARERGYTVVLDRRQTPYVKPELMITTETLTRLNKRLPVLQLKMPKKPKPKPPSVILGPGLTKQN
ncbi:MAG: OmpH family outer membrane protein [Alphaproteobacteria bacterium]|nr:OmpH family outer membrane protein [Alphaproteobacteria bacterium]